MNQIYYPVQPQIKDSTKLGIFYQEYYPREEFQEHIYCYWTLTSAKEIPINFTFHGIPDGCIDIFFNKNRYDKLFLVGLADSPVIHRLNTKPNYFGIRFMPGMINHFFSLPLPDIYKQSIPFETITSNKFSTFEEQLLLSNTLDEKIEICEDFLISQLNKSSYKENAIFRKCIDTIYLSNGNISMSKLAEDTNTSNRQIRRIFNSHLGLTPKLFSRVIRFQNCCQQLSRNKNIPKIELALASGYYDQAHFINDFKHFFGNLSSKI
jgi:AraC-like DNA-binding protein